MIWRKGIYNLTNFFTKPLSVKDHQSVMHLLVRVPTSSPALHSKRVGVNLNNLYDCIITLFLVGIT